MGRIATIAMRLTHLRIPEPVDLFTHQDDRIRRAPKRPHLRAQHTERSSESRALPSDESTGCRVWKRRRRKSDDSTREISMGCERHGGLGGTLEPDHALPDQHPSHHPREPRRPRWLGRGARGRTNQRVPFCHSEQGRLHLRARALRASRPAS